MLARIARVLALIAVAIALTTPLLNAQSSVWKTRIVGMWQVTDIKSSDMDTMSAANKKILKSMMTTVTMQFDEDGTCTTSLMGQAKTGNWQINGKTITLSDTGGKNSKAQIETLTDKKLVIKIMDGGSAGRLFLKRLQQPKTSSLSLPPEPILTQLSRKWKAVDVSSPLLDSLPADQKQQMKAMIASTTAEFRRDGSAIFATGGAVELGRWGVSGKTLISTTTTSPKQERATILELTDSKLVVRTESTSDTMIVTMEPAQ